jgi:hypothetical protein
LKEWTIEREEEQMTGLSKVAAAKKERNASNEFAVGADGCNTSEVVVVGEG